jgi:hypothetical protein
MNVFYRDNVSHILTKCFPKFQVYKYNNNKKKIQRFFAVYFSKTFLELTSLKILMA